MRATTASLALAAVVDAPVITIAPLAAAGGDLFPHQS